MREESPAPAKKKKDKKSKKAKAAEPAEEEEEEEEEDARERTQACSPSASKEMALQMLIDMQRRSHSSSFVTMWACRASRQQSWLESPNYEETVKNLKTWGLRSLRQLS